MKVVVVFAILCGVLVLGRSPHHKRFSFHKRQGGGGGDPCIPPEGDGCPDMDGDPDPGMVAAIVAEGILPTDPCCNSEIVQLALIDTGYTSCCAKKKRHRAYRSQGEGPPCVLPGPGNSNCPNPQEAHDLFEGYEGDISAGDCCDDSTAGGLLDTDYPSCCSRKKRHHAYRSPGQGPPPPCTPDSTCPSRDNSNTAASKQFKEVMDGKTKATKDLIKSQLGDDNSVSCCVSEEFSAIIADFNENNGSPFPDCCSSSKRHHRAYKREQQNPCDKIDQGDRDDLTTAINGLPDSALDNIDGVISVVKGALSDPTSPDKRRLLDLLEKLLDDKKARRKRQNGGSEGCPFRPIPEVACALKLIFDKCENAVTDFKQKVKDAKDAITEEDKQAIKDKLEESFDEDISISEQIEKFKDVVEEVIDTNSNLSGIPSACGLAAMAKAKKAGQGNGGGGGGP